jgi:flavin reductase (DIM6/NTAB) family NADH-FMN oxidoreductase RutF
MIVIDPTTQEEQDNYKLLIGSIIPRPIAFVTTLSEEGVLNAAPFSYFNIVTANPPMVSISVQRNGGKQKDTARNAIGRGAFVVHIADEDYIEQINKTAANLPSNESEVEFAGLTSVLSDSIDVPGVAEAKIRMECIVERVIPLGGTEVSPGCDLLIGRVVRFHIDEALYENGRIDPDVLKPVSRLAGISYSKLGSMFSIERPN